MECNVRKWEVKDGVREEERKGGGDNENEADEGKEERK